MQGDMCCVYLPDEERVVNINGAHLEPVLPQEKDKVKVKCCTLCWSLGELMPDDSLLPS